MRDEQITREDTYRLEVQEILNIFKKMPMGVCYSDPDMRIIRINPFMEERFGVKNKDAKGNHCYEVYGKYANDDSRKGKEKICEECQVVLALADGETHTHEREVKPGLFINNTSIPIKDGKGEITGVIELIEDITERKQMEGALKSSETKFTTFFNTGSDAVFVHRLSRAGPPGKFIEVNDTACRMLGYTREELLKLSPMDIEAPVPPEDTKKLIETLFTERHALFEREMVLKDSKRIPVEINNQLFEFEGQETVLSVVRDIKERKETENELREYIDFLDVVLESLAHPFYVIDANDYTIKIANSATFAGEIPEGTKCYELTHKRSEPCVGEHPCTLEEIKKSKKQVTLEHEHYDNEGNPKIVEVHGHPIFDREGNVTQIIEYNMDITERKQVEDALKVSEKKYRDLYDNAPDMYHALDKNGIIIDCNETEARMLGYKKKEIIGRPLTDFFTEESRKHFARDFPRLNEEKSQINLEREYIRKDGSSFVASINVFSEYDDNGKFVGTKATSRDIDKQKKIETALKKAYTDLKSLDELKGNLIANVTHELRTPITIAESAMELAMEEKDLKRKNELLIMAIEALNRQNAIVGDLIEASQLGMGVLEIVPEEVELAQNLEHIISEFEPVFVQRGLLREVNIEENLPSVNANKKHVDHILRNLLNNAIKFSAEGGKITLSASKKGKFVEVTIKDTGIGIPKDKLPRVFDRFYQVDSSTIRVYGGTGLGLSVVREMIEAHGGEIGVRSKEGKGSKFFFTLPIAT
jgi:PAS domain S-box-containing protein